MNIVREALSAACTLRKVLYYSLKVAAISRIARFLYDSMLETLM